MIDHGLDINAIHKKKNENADFVNIHTIHQIYTKRKVINLLVMILTNIIFQN